VHVTLSKEGLARLRNGLAKAGLDPRFFAWPPERDPERPPYRGLKPLEAEDAGIFFGREAPIVEALDTLRGLRDGAAPRMLIILGASGAGKSSFLRAGLLPRLARDDRNFLPLPLIRPERKAISGEIGLLHAVETALAANGLTQSRVSLRETIAGGAEKLRPLLQKLRDKAFATMLADENEAKPPVIVLAIDQAEELFLGDGVQEGQALLELIRDLVNGDRPGVIALFTIRSDSYDRLETAKALEGIRQQTFPLLPMPRGSYQTVIEGPAARLKDTNRSLIIEPRLTQRLLEDIEKGGGSDALPLLAFTLEQLYLDYGGSRSLKLTDYEAFGGIRGAIEGAVKRALTAADNDVRIPREHEARLALLRRGLIPWLAGIDPETANPRRRIARLADIPEEAAPLVGLLVEQRLLATDRILTREGDKETSEITIEPAHEALLRQWGLLRGWLEEDFAALTTLEGVKRSARDWAANGRRADWLNHAGSRLEEAEKVAARGDLVGDLSSNARDYLRQCRERELAVEDERRARIERERAEQERQLSDAQALAAANRRTARRTSMGLAAALLLAALAGWQWWMAQTQTRLAEQAAQNANAQRAAAVEQRDQALLTQSRFLADLANQKTREGDPLTAMLLAIEALPDANGTERPYAPEAEAALYGAHQQIQEFFLLAGDPYRMSGNYGEAPGFASAVYSPDGQRVATATGGSTARLWDAASGKLIASLSGHAESRNQDIPSTYINDIAFSPDGTRVVTSSQDKTARIWDSNTANTVAILSGHTDDVMNAAFSPDGTRVVTTSRDKTARIWDSNTGSTVAILSGHDDELITAAFSPDGRRVVTATANTTRVWNAETGAAIFVLQEGELALSSDGRRIVTSSAGHTARIWDANTGKAIAVLTGHKGEVFSAVFNPDGRRVITASEDTTGRIWDAETGKPIGVLAGHAGRITSVRFSPDGRRVVTASDDKTVRVWDSGTSKTIAVLSGHTDKVADAQFGPDGRRVLTISNCGRNYCNSEDHTARVWDAETGAAIAVLKGHEYDVETAAFSPDGSRVLTASLDRTARIWAITPPRYASRVLAGHTAAVGYATFSPDGKSVLTVSDDKTARVWDFETSAVIAVLSGHKDRVRGGEFSPDGRRVLTGSEDKTARIWDLTTGKTTAILLDNGNEIHSARFSPDGLRVLTLSGHTGSGVFLGPKTASIWDAQTGKTSAVLSSGQDDGIGMARFSPDGSRVLVISGKTASVWDAHTGNIRSWNDEKLIRDAAFSPNGDRIATASSAAFIWDAASGESVAVLSEHQDWVTSVAFSPDGLRLVTASADTTARIWDAETGSVVTVLEGHQRPVTRATFSPDGRYVLTVAFNGMRIWDAASGAVIASREEPVAFESPNDYLTLLQRRFSSSGQFSPDSERMMMGSDVLDIHSGKVIAPLSGGNAHFSPDGRSALTTSGTTARIWHLFESTQEQVDEGKRVVPRCLLPDEREKAFLEREPPQWCIDMEKWPYQDWQTWRQSHD
jgi:WD40 repeat protein